MGQQESPVSHPNSPSVFIFSLLYVLSCLVTSKLAKSNSVAVDSSKQVTSFISSFPQQDWLEMTELVALNINTYSLAVILHNNHKHIHTHTHIQGAGSLYLNT